MTNEEAKNYLISSGMSEEQIKAVIDAFTCEDCISRNRVIMLIDEATEKYPYKIIGLPDTYSNYNQGWADACEWLYANIESDNVPSVTPKFTDTEIQKMQELEQAQLEKAYELGKEEMQPSEDCISREEVRAELETLLKDADYSNENLLSYLHNFVVRLPSATPQPKTGHWIVIREEFEFMGGIVNEPRGCKCSNCNKVARFKSDYCPNCGAKMVESEEEE